MANGEFGVIYLEIRGAGQPAPQLVFQAVGVDGRKRGPAVPLTERVTERDHLRLVSFGREYGLTFWESGLRRAFYSRGTLGCPPP